ncbi:glycosyltransferase [Vibrio splendidus]
MKNDTYKRKILHVIPGLGHGGAEGVLYRLVTNSCHLYQHKVIVFMDEGKYGSLLHEKGVEVIYLRLKQNKFDLTALNSIYQQMKCFEPDLVQTWMYHADLIGGMCAKFSGVKHVAWGIRQTKLTFKSNKLTTILISRLCAILSYFVPSSIIACAEKARDTHISMGYKKIVTVIQNGYDLSSLYRSESLKLEFRKEINIDNDTILLGFVARFHPQKDHFNLLNSIHKIVQDNRNVKFKLVLVGQGCDIDNEVLTNKICSLNLTNYVILAGKNSNINQVMNGIDIHVLSSRVEGFPNVIAEAMACGTPCVSTDVGDAKAIIEDTGWVVEPENFSLLSVAILNAMTEINDPLNWEKRQNKCQELIRHNYALPIMVEKYEKEWGRIIEK